MLTIALSVSYAVASLATILMPYTRRMLYARGRILQRAADGVVVALAFVAFALAVLTAYYGMIAVAACIFILSASLNRRGQYREALSLSAAGYSTIALFWWRHDVGAASLVAYALGVFAVYRFAVWRPELAINSRRKFSIACVSLAAGAICITAGNIGGILNKEMFEITRLHWGVYLSAGELLREGARPFYDFPLQYGLGPATLVGAFCIAECWSTAHSMFAAVSALYALVIAATAVVATSSSDRSLPMTVTVLLACTLATGLFIGW